MKLLDENVELYNRSNEYLFRLFILSMNAEWNESSEESWYEARDSSQGISVYRIIAVVVLLALFLILSGFPLSYPLAFVAALVVLSIFGIFCGLMNREFVRALRGKS
jgi:VIT1/CCC1 family predicted Fe2+/Mn2+ transporter